VDCVEKGGAERNVKIGLYRTMSLQKLVSLLSDSTLYIMAKNCMSGYFKSDQPDFSLKVPKEHPFYHLQPPRADWRLTVSIKSVERVETTLIESAFASAK
jgi:hypothetical protein